METKNLFTSDFKLNENEKYHITIQVCSEGIGYVILNIDTKKYCGLKQFPISGNRDEKREMIKNILQSEPHFKHTYASAYYQVQSYKAMLVPETLFDSNNLKTFLKFHHDVDDKDRIHFSSLKPAEAFIIFSTHVTTEDEILSFQPKLKYSHHCIPFIHSAINNSNINDSSSTINIHFGKDFFDVLIVRNKKIQLFNSFFYKKYTDVVYFIANILNLFSIQPANSKIVLSGVIDEKCEVELELGKIFPSINFAKFSLDFKYTEAFSSLPQHQYVHLLNLYNCELLAENSKDAN